MTLQLKTHQMALLSHTRRALSLLRKDNNWRTLVINANSISNKEAELAAIAEYCDPDLMLISETKLSPDIRNGEFVPEGYMGRFPKDRKRGAGGS